MGLCKPLRSLSRRLKRRLGGFKALDWATKTDIARKRREMCVRHAHRNLEAGVAIGDRFSHFGEQLRHLRKIFRRYVEVGVFGGTIHTRSGGTEDLQSLY